jgi:hypothetical protein
LLSNPVRARFKNAAVLRALTISLCSFPAASWGAGEQLIDAIMRSDFGTSEFEGECALDDCGFDTQQLSAAGALPAWVGRRDMLPAGGAVSATRLEQGRRDRTVYSGGLLGARW